MKKDNCLQFNIFIMEDNNSNIQNKINNTITKITLPCVINLIERTKFLKKEKAKLKKNLISLKQVDQTLIGKEMKINQLKCFINKFKDENKNLKTKEDGINQYIIKLDKKEKKLEEEQFDYLNIQKEINSIKIEQTIISHILNDENKNKENNIKTIRNNNKEINKNINSRKKRRVNSLKNKINQKNNSDNVFYSKSQKNNLNLVLNEGEILNKYSNINKRKLSYQKTKSLTVNSSKYNENNSFEGSNLKKKNKIKTPPNNNIRVKDKLRNLDKYLSNGKKKYSTTSNITFPSKQYKSSSKNSESSVNSSLIINKNKNKCRSVEKELKNKFNLNIKLSYSKRNKNNNKLHKNKSVENTKKIDISNEDIFIRDNYKNKKSERHLYNNNSRNDFEINKKKKNLEKKLKTSSNFENEKEIHSQRIVYTVNNNNKNKSNNLKINNNKNKCFYKNNLKISKNNSNEKNKIVKKENNKLQKNKFCNLLLSGFKKNNLRRKKEFLNSFKKIKKPKFKKEIKNTKKIKELIKKYYLNIIKKEILLFSDNNENIKEKSNSEKTKNTQNSNLLEDKELNDLINKYLSEKIIKENTINQSEINNHYLENLNKIKNLTKEAKKIEQNMQNFILNLNKENESS